MKKSHSTNSQNKTNRKPKTETSQELIEFSKYWRVAIFLLLSLLIPQTIHADTLPYYNSVEFTPHWIEDGSAQLEGFHSVGQFSLSNQEGEQVNQDTVSGKIFVANFFFSTCPGICPRLKSKLEKVQEAYLADPDILILSHSINPDFDTPEVLKDYAERNNVISGKWHLLTGSRDEIYALARDTYFANEDLGELQKTEEFLHSENLLLVDRNMKIRGIYNGLNASSVQNLIDDIALLKS